MLKKRKTICQRKNQSVRTQLKSPQDLLKKELGKKGEDIAVQYLRKKGYIIVDRNFKKRYGELDIVAINNSTLVFIEVKTRVGNKYGTPEESITPWKINELIKTAQYYSYLHPKLPKLLRIDMIGIIVNGYGLVRGVNHIENITS